MRKEKNEHQFPAKIIAEKAEFLADLGTPEHNFVLDPFQKEAIEHVASNQDVLVVAPTGSGKTYIAIKSIESQIMQNRRAVYTTPLKALSNSKYKELKRIFEPAFSVGILTGDRKIDSNSNVVVSTTEIFRNELYSGDADYGLVVLDEVHYLADSQRGPVWEESIILADKSCTLLMLSASISNASEIAEWVSKVRGKECRIVIKKDRPVELRLGFVHPDYGGIPLFDRAGRINVEVNKFYSGKKLDAKGMRFEMPRQGPRRRKGKR